MRESTRVLKETARKDIANIYYHNNSKSRTRTAAQNEQSRQNKFDFYCKKWTELLDKAETAAQINICKDVLNRTKYIR